MKLNIGVIFLLVACRGTETVIEKQDNSAPSVMIVSHSPDAEIREGYQETFRATVSDDDNSFDELTTAWYIGDEIVCDWETVTPGGESYCDIVFESEDNNVIVEVRDPIGAGGRSEIGVIIIPTDAPTAEILSPIQNSTHYLDQLMYFSASVGDNEDAPDDLIVSWSSNLDGELIIDTTPDADGVISDYTSLSQGQHAIELRVEDTSGKVTKDQLVVTVGAENEVPSCEIVSPEDSTTSILGESLVLRGIASDANIPTTDLVASWYSDKDGDLGVSTITTSGDITLSTNTLSANDHVIGLRVEDEVGAVCVDEILLQIGEEPTVSIVAPQSGDVVSLGDSILFNGVLNDAEDSVTNLSVEWESSTSGQMITGTPDSQGYHQFSRSDLEAGVHTITLTGTDSTGLEGSDTVTIRVNTPPNTPSITLSPVVVYGSDSLTVSISSSSDDDGDPVSHLIQWYENGVLTSNTLSTVASTDLDVGEVWTVRVTPNDGYTDGNFAEASITVENSLPTVSTPIISSNSNGVFNDSVLTCASTVMDTDETVVAAYTWDLNGSIVLGDTVDLSNYIVSAGDSVSCMVSATDSNGGVGSNQTTELVVNRSPSISGVSISPSSPGSQDVLTCSVTSSDLDGDTLTESMEWFVAGSSVSTGMTLDLSSVVTSPNDTVECVVVVEDPSGDSDQQSSSVTVLNTNPTIDILTLSPSGPTLLDTLSCYAEYSDADGDTPSIVFSYTNQSTGATFTPTTSSTNLATLDISSTDAEYDHVLTCSVTATDSDGGTVSSSVSTTIVNTSPIFDQEAVITPSAVEIGTNVTCSALASDPDDGVASLTYVWQVNGLQVSTGSTWTVSSSLANVGDDLTCRAVAIDFEGNATTSTSVPSVISNTVPVVSGVVLNTLSPYTNDILSVSPTTFDFNGDSVTLNYEWHVIDAITGSDSIVQTGIGSSLSSLDGGQSFAFDRDDEVYVNVTPNDGTDNGTTVESDHAVVLNTAPSAPSVSVTSTANPPIEGVDDLTCTIVGGSTDDDGDSVTYTYTWYDPTGTDVQIFPNTTTLSDVFLGSATTSGLWECVVEASDGTDITPTTADIEVEADWPGASTFTNCTQTGTAGPSQSQCDSAYSGGELDGLVIVTGGIQTFVIPSTGVYSIESVGAAGFSATSNGGYGAQAYGEFAFIEGEIIKVLVGQQGTGSTYGGGGGGTFVVDSSNSPLLVAGGGGGQDTRYGECSSMHGSSSTSGNSACNCISPSYSGGTSGNGGGGNTGGGGGGLNSNGGGSSGGTSFISGGNGGYGTWGSGGFGGGSGTDDDQGGAGGGYSGGAGCDENGNSGGGGSYLSGSNTSASAGANSGHGYVIIDKL